MAKLIFLITFLLAAIARAAQFQTRVSLIHEFPVGTWLENLAIRRNGHILVTSITKPQVYEVHPSGRESPQLVATIPNHLALAGITEVEPDVFYVAANNFSIATLTPQPNASAIYRLDLSKKSHRPIVPELVASFDNSILLNGLTTFDCAKKLILIGDSGKGWVWRLDVSTGKKHIVAQDPRMAIIDAQGEPIGVNGIKLSDHWLYFSNSNQALLARLPLSPDALATGPSELVAKYEAPDDILLVHGQNPSVLASGNDEIRYIDGPIVQTVSKSPLLKGSTAIQGSKARGVYFVSTNGGVAQYRERNVTVPGRVVRVDIRN